MRKITVLFTLLLSVTVFAADHAILVSPQWLNQHKSDPSVVVLQVNFL